ncbi:MAG: nitroreductase/dihydropteridine reductase [Polaribacter sp.]|jgi:nitroreductase/dihydropteridine reductase
MNLIDNPAWRYAAKKFDVSKKVSSENLDHIKKAIQLSASSYGLQLYKVLIIESNQ